jgi:DNA-binding NarL/FixJ family response regulator
MKTISILVADDHEVVRHGLCRLLETQPGWKVLEASNGNEAVSKATQLHPDICILDIDMPQLNGLEATRQILKALPDMPVLLLSAYSTEAMIDKALEARVRGYVLKTDAAKDLVNAVQALLQGRTFFTAIVSRYLMGALDAPSAKHGASALTQREAEIVQLLCEGKSNKEIATVLQVSTRTIENHRAHIMQKLGLRSFSDLIRYAIRNGIVQP